MNTLYYEEHISLFVGDGACVHCAKELNAESVLVTTGPESMQKAVSDAVEICEMRRSVIAENHFYKTVIEKSSLAACHLQFKQGTYLLRAFSPPVMRIPYTTSCAAAFPN